MRIAGRRLLLWGVHPLSAGVASSRDTVRARSPPANNPTVTRTDAVPVRVSGSRASTGHRSSAQHAAVSGLFDQPVSVLLQQEPLLGEPLGRSAHPRDVAVVGAVPLLEGETRIAGCQSLRLRPAERNVQEPRVHTRRRWRRAGEGGSACGAFYATSHGPHAH